MATRIPDPEPQQDAARPLESGIQRKKERDTRIVVRITRIGTRLLDEDNLWGSTKFLIDALCRAGLIPGDSPGEIRREVGQRLVQK